MNQVYRLIRAGRSSESDRENAVNLLQLEDNRVSLQSLIREHTKGKSESTRDVPALAFVDGHSAARSSSAEREIDEEK